MKTTVQRKPNGQKKAKGGVDLRQATSSLKVYNTANSVNGGPVRSVPAAMGSMKVTGRPKTENARNGDCRIVHREYLGEVSLESTFKSTRYAINPGLPQSFPWLSSIAQRYESYRFEALRFCYETSSPSSQKGTVLLVPDYDSLDAAPVSKVQALAYRNSARAQPWLSFCQTSSREDLSKRNTYYVRRGTPPSGSDLRLYDTGNLFLCVQGDADVASVGELWVEYDVKLMTPQLEDSAVSATITNTGTPSIATPFGFRTAPDSGTLQMSIDGDDIKFLQAWEGIVNFAVGATTPLTLSGAVTGSAAVAEVTTTLGTSSSMGLFKVKALQGQVLTLGLAGMSGFSYVYAYFGEFDW